MPSERERLVEDPSLTWRKSRQCEKCHAWTFADKPSCSRCGHRNVEVNITCEVETRVTGTITHIQAPAVRIAGTEGEGEGGEVAKPVDYWHSPFIDRRGGVCMDEHTQEPQAAKCARGEHEARLIEFGQFQPGLVRFPNALMTITDKDGAVLSVWRRHYPHNSPVRSSSSMSSDDCPICNGPHGQHQPWMGKPCPLTTARPELTATVSEYRHEIIMKNVAGMPIRSMDDLKQVEELERL